MIEIRCIGCQKKLAEREADNIVLDTVTAKAPADVMCNKCGRITHIPAVPTLTPREPEPTIIAAPAVTNTVLPAPVTVITDDKDKKK